MKWYVIIVCCTVCIMCSSCRQADVRTFRIKVPGMKNQACVQLVANAVGKMAGVHRDKIGIDPEEKIVVVTYDHLVTAEKNIEFAVAEAGFDANEVPAKAEAVKALPPECK